MTARRNGEIPRNADTEMAINMLFAVLMFSQFFVEDPTDASVDRLVKQLIRSRT